ncbi:AAI domain-containing protein [Citrus sinensis]|nr:AAI domain-containing protein [Citrus sinensis]
MRLQTVLIAVIVAAAFCGGDVAAQSSDCNNVLISMSPCLDYITGNSSRPSSSCCSELSNTVKSQPQCLCEVIKGGGSSASSLGINVNQTQAMALPSACNVQTPPVSRCNGNGSKTVPSTNRVDSSNATKLTFSLLFFWLFVASYTSSFSAV